MARVVMWALLLTACACQPRVQPAPPAEDGSSAAIDWKQYEILYAVAQWSPYPEVGIIQRGEDVHDFLVDFGFDAAFDSPLIKAATKTDFDNMWLIAVSWGEGPDAAIHLRHVYTSGDELHIVVEPDGDDEGGGSPMLLARVPRHDGPVFVFALNRRAYEPGTTLISDALTNWTVSGDLRGVQLEVVDRNDDDARQGFEITR